MAAVPKTGWRFSFILLLFFVYLIVVKKTFMLTQLSFLLLPLLLSFTAFVQQSVFPDTLLVHTERSSWYHQENYIIKGNTQKIATLWIRRMTLCIASNGQVE